MIKNKRLLVLLLAVTCTLLSLVYTNNQPLAASRGWPAGMITVNYEPSCVVFDAQGCRNLFPENNKTRILFTGIIINLLVWSAVSAILILAIPKLRSANTKIRKSKDLRMITIFITGLTWVASCIYSFVYVVLVDCEQGNLLPWLFLEAVSALLLMWLIWDRKRIILFILSALFIMAISGTAFMFLVAIVLGRCWNF